MEGGGRREEEEGAFPASCFNLLSSPETTGFFHKAENVLENVINICVLFPPLSPKVFSHFFSVSVSFLHQHH